MARPGTFTKNDPRRMVGPRPNSGRKPVAATELKKKLADYVPDAMRAFELCVKWMDDPEWEKPLRLAAAKEVMNRVLGMPKQSVEHSGTMSIVDLIVGNKEEAGE